MVVVDPPEGPAPPAALALEQPDERALELLAGARVDDGVHTAVEVAQPENDLENDFRRLQGREERTLGEIGKKLG